MDNIVKKQVVISLEHYEAYELLARRTRKMLLAIQQEGCTHALIPSTNVDESIRYLEHFLQPNEASFVEMMANAYPEGTDATCLKAREKYNG